MEPRLEISEESTDESIALDSGLLGQFDSG